MYRYNCYAKFEIKLKPTDKHARKINNAENVVVENEAIR